MALTFNQIQFRLFTLLSLLFIGGVLGYRYFIELPKLNKSLGMIIEKEVSTVNFSIQDKLNILSAASFDYAVWTSAYDFMEDHNSEFIEENIVANTFSSLKIDGIFYINKNNEILLVHGENHLTGKPLDFRFFDFKRHPENLAMLPTPITSEGAPSKSGFINTLFGPAMYSSTQVRDSTMQGEEHGFLIMVKLLSTEFIDTLSRYTSTKVTYHPLVNDPSLSNVYIWNTKSKVNANNANSYLQLNDTNGNPVTMLSIQHSITPNIQLFNREVIVFILVTFLFFLFVYNLISKTIIEPVKNFAISIKKFDIEKGEARLDENHLVQELNVVSKNFNNLADKVQLQTKILAKQVTTDQLTQILNRRGLTDALEQFKELCIRRQIGFIFIMCDIDHFKAYNDTLGHVEGDEALLDIAKILKSQCKRASDTCGRFGGEEFTLIFSEMTEANLQRKLENILATIQEQHIPHPKSNTAKFITLSFGATIVKPADVKNFNLSSRQIIKSADTALYQAKAAGRNCFVINYFSDLEQ